jgi:hypothetical protein
MAFLITSVYAFERLDLVDISADMVKAGYQSELTLCATLRPYHSLTIYSCNERVLKIIYSTA